MSAKIRKPNRKSNWSEPKTKRHWWAEGFANKFHRSIFKFTNQTEKPRGTCEKKLVHFFALRIIFKLANRSEPSRKSILYYTIFSLLWTSVFSSVRFRFGSVRGFPEPLRTLIGTLSTYRSTINIFRTYVDE